jgi:hypothetical protein
MVARRLDDCGTRVRRATRHDLPALRALIPGNVGERSERFDRRMLRSLAGDVYVAERRPGEPLGVLALSFARSFADGHWRAYLDGVWVSGEAAELVGPLLAHAAWRAARRHCRELVVPGPVGVDLRAALDARGFAEGTCWRTPLASAAAGGERGPTAGS